MIFKMWFQFQLNKKIKEQVFNLLYPTTAPSKTTSPRKKPPPKPPIIPPVTEAIREEPHKRIRKSKYNLPSLLSSVKVIPSGSPR